jgi:hypothetical protein
MNSVTPAEGGGTCWDWYGATNDEFDTKNGVGIKFVMNVIDDLPRWLAAH